MSDGLNLADPESHERVVRSLLLSRRLIGASLYVVVCLVAGCDIGTTKSTDGAASRSIVRADQNSRGNSARKGASEFIVHSVESPYQSENVTIRVLLPESLDESGEYPIVLVLPVEKHRETRYGDGLSEVRSHDLHNEYGVIFVAPSFSEIPWYADHPTNLGIRQERHLLAVVVPFLDRTYPTLAGAKGRFLLGFSKSGWGAYSLMLRHPDVFGRAVAWDAPLMAASPSKWGMQTVFGDQANFEKYEISSLLEHRAELLQRETRLILAGSGNFKDHHDRIHRLMQQLKVKHVFREGPARDHTWHSGWVSDAVALLLNELECESDDRVGRMKSESSAFHGEQGRGDLHPQTQFGYRERISSSGLNRAS